MKDRPSDAVSRRSLLRGMGAVLGAGVASRALGLRDHASAAPAEYEEKVMNDVMRIPAWYYQHFDADFSREVPEEAFGGWQKAELEFSRSHTAVVVMHAWDAGTFEEFPGWWRCVPYIQRANAIIRNVFPRLLAAVRNSDFPLFHVVGGADYYKDLPGYRRAVELAGPAPAPLEQAVSDPLRDKLNAFHSGKVFVGANNAEDVSRGFARLDFPAPARPIDDEGVAENGAQLFALCKERGINHLIYCGFAINWCLLLSPGGMAEMQKYGIMCSALREATVAVENKETARAQLCKEVALWRVALAYGFVFDVDDFVTALTARTEM